MLGPSYVYSSAQSKTFFADMVADGIAFVTRGFPSRGYQGRPGTARHAGPADLWHGPARKIMARKILARHGTENLGTEK